MAILITIAGCILAYKSKLSTEFCTIWGVVVASYFGRMRGNNATQGSNTRDTWGSDR